MTLNQFRDGFAGGAGDDPRALYGDRRECRRREDARATGEERAGSDTGGIPEGASRGGAPRRGERKLLRETDSLVVRAEQEEGGGGQE